MEVSTDEQKKDPEVSHDELWNEYWNDLSNLNFKDDSKFYDDAIRMYELMVDE